MIGVENNAFREDDILDSIMQERARRSSRGLHPTAEALNNIVNQANYTSDLDWARGEVL